MMIPHLLAENVLQPRRLHIWHYLGFRRKRPGNIAPLIDWKYSFSQNTMKNTKIQMVSETVLYTLLYFFRPISFYILLLDFIVYRRLSVLQVRGLHLYVPTTCIGNFVQNFLNYVPHLSHGRVTIIGRSL
jgi:hypothetical protein